jgi:hypothetical protein
MDHKPTAVALIHTLMINLDPTIFLAGKTKSAFKRSPLPRQRGGRHACHATTETPTDGETKRREQEKGRRGAMRNLPRLRQDRGRSPVTAEHEFGFSPSLILLLPAALLSH